VYSTWGLFDGGNYRALDRDIATISEKLHFLPMVMQDTMYRPEKLWPQIADGDRQYCGTDWYRAKYTMKRVCDRGVRGIGTFQHGAWRPLPDAERRMYAHQRILRRDDHPIHDAELSGSARWAGCRPKAGRAAFCAQLGYTVNVDLDPDRQLLWCC